MKPSETLTARVLRNLFQNDAANPMIRRLQARCERDSDRRDMKTIGYVRRFYGRYSYKRTRRGDFAVRYYNSQTGHQDVVATAPTWEAVSEICRTTAHRGVPTAQFREDFRAECARVGVYVVAR